MGADIRWRPAVSPALILVHDRLEHPLWDRQAAAFADAVEDRLESVSVTSVDLSRGLPRLHDALRAAKFVGAQSALVFVRDELTARRVAGLSTTVPFAVVVAPDWTADAVAATFRAETDDSERRACA